MTQPDAYEPQSGQWDEAVTEDGGPRPASADALAAVAAHRPGALADAVRGDLADAGVVFKSVDGDKAFNVDPVPRVFDAGEWAALERGLAQRVIALNAYLADVYGERRIFREGAVPERLLGAEGYQDDMRGVTPPGGVWTHIAGLDVVRDEDGRLQVLEDNLTTPSGAAYAVAARDAVLGRLEAGHVEPRPLDGLPALLRGALLAAAPGVEDPHVVVLTDGPSNSAHWEHEWLAATLGVPLVVAGDLTVSGGEARHAGRRVDVLYRRSDQDRVEDPLGRLLLPAIRAGTLGVVNAYGTQAGDDKLAHAYVETMIRFYLGEAPLLPSVPTLDLGRPEALEQALDTLEDLVVKPRNGYGGIGVVIVSQITREEVEALRDRLREDPTGYIAQPRVALSSHPTVIDGRLEPRHVDLRPFVFLHGPGDARVLPGGLTRVALGEGQLVVNSTQNGGVKDTWVR